MPIRPSKNVVQKIVEMPPELAEEVQAFADGRGLYFKDVVIKALRRHLDNPPPVVPDPPLPECEPDVVNPPAKPKRSRKKT